MKFYTRIKLEGISIVRFSHMANREFSSEGVNGDLLLTDPNESQNRNDMSLCIRGLGSFKLTAYNSRDNSGCLEYDDFVVGSTPEDRPQWFDYVKERIVETTAYEDYGPEQGLKVAESIVYGSAEARIRCEQSMWNRSGCVFKVKIVAKGNHTSFGDALRLHAQILSGEAN